MNFYENKIKESAEKSTQALNLLVNSINLYKDMPESLREYAEKAEKLLNEIEELGANLEATLSLEALKPYLHDATLLRAREELKTNLSSRIEYQKQIARQNCRAERQARLSRRCEEENQTLSQRDDLDTKSSF